MVIQSSSAVSPNVSANSPDIPNAELLHRIIAIYVISLHYPLLAQFSVLEWSPNNNNIHSVTAGIEPDSSNFDSPAWNYRCNNITAYNINWPKPYYSCRCQYYCPMCMCLHTANGELVRSALSCYSILTSCSTTCCCCGLYIYCPRQRHAFGACFSCW